MHTVVVLQISEYDFADNISTHLNAIKYSPKSEENNKTCIWQQQFNEVVYTIGIKLTICYVVIIIAVVFFLWVFLGFQFFGAAPIWAHRISLSPCSLFILCFSHHTIDGKENWTVFRFSQFSAPLLSLTNAKPIHWSPTSFTVLAHVLFVSCLMLFQQTYNTNTFVAAAN